MAKLTQDNEAYGHFQQGTSRHVPLSAVDQKMLEFAILTASRPITKTHGQILRNFGMYPPEFWNKVQGLATHPGLSPKERAKLAEVFPDPSRPGPMGGGAPISDGKSFSHGVMW